MSNKTRLQANNTNLQTLINKVNSLPDPGCQYVTGTLTVTSGTKTKGTVVAKIDQLPFKPSYVIITLQDGNNIRMSTTSYYGLLSIQAGLTNTENATYTRKYSSTYAYGYALSTSYANINITDNGFELVSNNNNLYVGSRYTYIAIGGDLVTTNTLNSSSTDQGGSVGGQG